MQFPNIRIITVVAFLFFCWNAPAQNKAREINIHENVTLVERPVSDDVPEDIVKQFQNFLPILEEVLRENTTDESDACGLVVRVTAGFKEIGSAKVKRPTAQISAYRKKARQEFLGTFILHSYINDGLVNKEETEQFLVKQILEPAVCRE